MQNQTSFFVSTQRNNPTMVSLVKTEFKELKNKSMFQSQLWMPNHLSFITLTVFDFCGNESTRLFFTPADLLLLGI
jgi:hypothetical protein